MELFIYTDASFSKASGVAVLGYLAFNSKEQHDHVYDSEAAMKTNGVLIRMSHYQETNNIRAELRAVLDGLNFCSKFPPEKRKRVVLFTDCQTVVNLIERRTRLEALGFVSKSKNVILANADLYKDFYKIYDQIKPEINWVKGHKSNSLKNNVDKNFSILDRAIRSLLRQGQ
jgi:ribonuclease HI